MVDSLRERTVQNNNHWDSNVGDKDSYMKSAPHVDTPGRDNVQL